MSETFIEDQEDLARDVFVGETDEPEIGEPELDQPSADFVGKTRRAPRAKTYENKTKRILNAVMRAAAANEATLPDAAAIIMHGKQFSEKAGDLANADPRVRRAIDFLSDGTENPYVAFAVAALPMAAQLYRNHQDVLAPKAVVESVKARRSAGKERPGRKFRIPFTKRTITIRFRMTLPSVTNFTNDPHALTAYVFENEEIVTALQKAGVEVAYNPNGNSAKKSRA